MFTFVRQWCRMRYAKIIMGGMKDDKEKESGKSNGTYIKCIYAWNEYAGICIHCSRIAGNRDRSSIRDRQLI